MRECGLRDKAGKIKFWRVSLVVEPSGRCYRGAGRARCWIGDRAVDDRRRVQGGNVIDDVVLDGVSW